MIQSCNGNRERRHEGRGRLFSDVVQEKEGDRQMLKFLKAVRSLLPESARRRGWRVGHQGRDSMFYDELIDGAWERIEIDGEMQCGSGDPQHVVWFPTEEQWARLPNWTAGRRAEILKRVQGELRPPRYEYE